jgi:MFS family permease
VIWRNPSFRWLILGRGVSLLGNAVAPIALAFAIIDLTGSATDLGLVVGARSLANVLFLLVGGVVADRVPRKLVLIGSMTTAALSQTAVTALVFSGTAKIGTLMALSAVNGTAAAFSMPATAALLGQVIPPADRQRGNAINSFMRSGAMIIGAGLGGVLVATLGPGVGLAVDSATFALAAIFFSRVPGTAGPDQEKKHPFADLREGWRELATHTWLWAVVLGFGVLNAVYAGVFQVLGPVVADASIGRRAWGFVLAAQTAGMVLGAIVAMRVRLSRPLFVGVLCMFTPIPMMLLLAREASAPMLIVAALIAGFGIEQFAIAWEVSMQTHVAPDKLARVYSWDMLGSFIAIPLGSMLAGPAAAHLGVGPAIVGGTAIMTATIGLIVAARSVRTLPGPHLVSVRNPHPDPGSLPVGVDVDGPADPAHPVAHGL